MDFSRPVEALIPGAQGRVLGALARVDAELPVSTLAAVAGVGRTRASAVLGKLADLGVVSRRRWVLPYLSAWSAGMRSGSWWQAWRACEVG